MAQALIGVDVGASVVRCTLFDLDGNERAVSSREAALLHPREGWAEMEMEAVWTAVRDCLQAAVATAAPRGYEIAAIGVTGQGDGTWLVDSEGRPVRPAITWLDGRTSEMVTAAQVSGLSDQVFAITGTALNTANQALHIRWLHEHEPESLQRSAAALRAKDWVFLRLTGEISTDETDASPTYFAAGRRSFAPQLLDLFGITAWGHLIPEPRPPHENKAPLLAAVAAEIGLPPGVPVVGGPTGLVALNLGAGVLQPGDACTILDATAVHQVVADAPLPAPQQTGCTLAHAPAQRLVRVLPGMPGAQHLQQFARAFYAQEMEQARARGVSFWNEAEDAAAAVSLGSGGVIYHPSLDAAQFADPGAHHDPAALLRAVYEGVVLAALDCYAQFGLLRVLRFTGSSAQSPFWAQLFADALGCPVQTVLGRDPTTRGAAMTAGVAAGLFVGYEQGVDALVRVGRVYQPDLANGLRFQNLLGLYRSTRGAAGFVTAERPGQDKKHPWEVGRA